MIIIGDTLISDEVYTEQFLCDLAVCKGGCCVHGDAGAPLEADEAEQLEEIYDIVRPFMMAEGIDASARQGLWVRDEENELTTPLVDGKQCAYVFFDGEGVAKCAIEAAFDLQLIDFQRPICCHLYPIRVIKYPRYEALNYHRWPICDCARKKGKALNVRVYRFVKDALIRKYGREWYEELESYIQFSLEQVPGQPDM